MDDVDKTIREVLTDFQIPGIMTEGVPYGSGHINDTFRLTFSDNGKTTRYILQRMNKNIFLKPLELMENVVGVTSWLKKKIIENGGDPTRETLNILPAKDGRSYCLDKNQDYWRIYAFIEDATSFDQVEKEDDFYQSAVTFGHFQQLLADYPADTLHETIPNLHNTADRLDKFEQAVKADCVGRVASVQAEIAFVRDNSDLAHVLGDMQKAGELPLRVTHNDTKLNNIMIDNATGKGLCVIDLDTVMPGLAANDFGDSIRFGASTGAEDEPDLSKVECSMELFDLYTKGFILGCGGKLTEKELDTLPLGAMVMTYECGVRFLTDYLEGDHYFKIHRDGQNLDRARTQFKLVEDMKNKKDVMDGIVKKYK